MAKEISILDEKFEVSEPYAEGHTLTEIEAKVLNQVRAENIGNNFRAKIKASKEGKEGAKSMDEIRQEFQEYDSEYQFSVGAARGSRSTMSPLEKECQRVAKAWLVNHLRSKDTTFKAYEESVGKEAAKEKISEIAEQEPIVKMAKENLKRKEKQADLDLAVET